MSHNVLQLGYWEIWRAIAQLEEEAGNTVHHITTREDTSDPDTIYHTLHIAIPFDPLNPNAYFDAIINVYDRHHPNRVINHGTVPPWTTEKLRQYLHTDQVAYSPVNGMHPDLYPSIKTHFTKFTSQARSVDYLKSIWIRDVQIMPEKDLELAKIMITTQYGRDILLAKQISLICDDLIVDFENVYTRMTHAYNEGYTSLDQTHVIRPILKPYYKKIGGHCIAQNFELLPTSHLKNACKFLNEQNNVDDQPHTAA